MKSKLVYFLKNKKVLILLFVTALIFLCFDEHIERYNRQRYGVAKGVKLEGLLVEGLLEKELYELIEQIAPEIEYPLRNAYLDRETSQLVKEVVGKKIHYTHTVENILAAKPGSRVSLVIIDIDPVLTSSLIKSLDRSIGYFHTYLGGGGGGRVNNIIRGSQLINNSIIPPGEIFSFNETVGPVTRERGFTYAPIISGGQVVPGIGGGLCQLASTLYNAVLEAELEVIERTPHSRPVGYVPRGKDATVSGYIDFKFRNNTGKFILLETTSAGYKIAVTISTNENTY